MTFKIDSKITLREYLNTNKFSLEYLDFIEEKNIDKYLSDEGSLLFSGTNDYRKYNKGDTLFIPSLSTFSDGSALGNGLYVTPNYEGAIAYAQAASQPIGTGGRGCSKNVFIRKIRVENNKYDEIKGIILREKKHYTDDKWQSKIKDMDFIVNGDDKDGSEIVFIRNKDNLLIIDEIVTNESDWCSKKYNDISIGKYIEDFTTLFPHDCLSNKSIECPTSCNYLKEKDQLPTNKDGTKINCGTDKYEIKYFKYKILKIKRIF